MDLNNEVNALNNKVNALNELNIIASSYEDFPHTVSIKDTVILQVSKLTYKNYILNIDITAENEKELNIKIKEEHDKISNMIKYYPTLLKRLETIEARLHPYQAC